MIPLRADDEGGGGRPLVRSNKLAPEVAFTRASAASYRAPDDSLQYVGLDTPRYQTGFRSEGQRTQSSPGSDTFSTGWSITNVASRNVGPGLAPDGSARAVRVVISAGTTSGQLRRAYTWTAGTTYVMSCYFKVAEATNFALSVDSGAFTAGGVASGVFDLVANTAVASGNASRAIIIPWGNGWYRCAIVFTPTISASATLRSAATTATAADGSQGGLMFGHQVEVGGILSSYIPNAGSTDVTRAADVATYLSPASQQAQGTIIARALIPFAAPVGAEQGIAALHNATANNRIALVNPGGTSEVRLRVSNGGAQTADLLLGTMTPGTSFAAGFSYGAGKVTGVMSGNAAQSATLTIPAVTALAIGAGLPEGASSLFGEIVRLDMASYAAGGAQLTALLASI